MALPSLPDRPIEIELRFPDVASWDKSKVFAADSYAAPAVDVVDGRIVVYAKCAYLRSFARPENVGDRLLVEAFARGAGMVAGQALDERSLVGLVSRVVADPGSCFLHFTVAQHFREMAHVAFELPEPRLIQPENNPWARIGLATSIEKPVTPGVIEGAEEASTFIHSVVDELWACIKRRLETLDRREVVLRALLNNEAIARDRMVWKQTARARSARVAPGPR